MNRLYLDACTIIYLLEGAAPFQTEVARRILRHRADPAAVLVTSALSRLECRVRPIRAGDGKGLAAFDTFFGAGRLLVEPITTAIIDRATELRARHGFRTPDALHLATAIETGASYPWSQAHGHGSRQEVGPGGLGRPHHGVHVPRRARSAQDRGGDAADHHSRHAGNGEGLHHGARTSPPVESELRAQRGWDAGSASPPRWAPRGAPPGDTLTPRMGLTIGWSLALPGTMDAATAAARVEALIARTARER